MKKLLSIFVTAIIAMSIMSIGVCASEPLNMSLYPKSITVITEVEQADGTVKQIVTTAQFLGLGYINADGVNLRSGPSTSTASLGLMYKKDSVGIYANDNTNATWAYVSVRSGNCSGKSGYVHQNNVTITNPLSIENESTTK